MACGQRSSQQPSGSSNAGSAERLAQKAFKISPEWQVRPPIGSYAFTADTFQTLLVDIRSTIYGVNPAKALDGLWLLWMFPGKFILAADPDSPNEEEIVEWVDVDDHSGGQTYSKLSKYQGTDLLEALRVCDIREWDFFYQLNVAEYRWQKKDPRGPSYPTNRSTIALFASDLPSELVMTIVRFVGAHNLEPFWPCTKCKPYWWSWYCRDCRLFNHYEEWSHQNHFGRCGKACLCCRSVKMRRHPRPLVINVCRACEDLWQLKGTCQMMRTLLKAYDGL